MARSAKTNHVMSLVGDKNKQSSSQKDGESGKTRSPQTKESSPIKILNPALLPVEEEQRPNPQKAYEPERNEKGEYEQERHEKSEYEQKRHESGKYEPNAEEKEQGYINSREIPPKQKEEKPEPPEDKRKNGITAIVPELINQELEAIARRFHIAPTDSNLWKLTKAALETIRPEFSRNSEEYGEKCSRLRPKVILEMTKAAIAISKSDRK